MAGDHGHDVTPVADGQDGVPRSVRPGESAGGARRCVEPPGKPVDARPVIRLVVSSAVGADPEVVVRLFTAGPRHITGDRRAHVKLEVFGREQLAAGPVASVQPEPADAGEIPGCRYHAAALVGAGVEQVSVLKLQGREIVPGRLVEASAEDPLQCQGVEANGEVVVCPRLAGPLGAGVAADHVGQVPKRHGPVLGAKPPAPSSDGFVHAGDLSVAYGEEQQGRQDRLGGGVPLELDLRIAPGADQVTVLDDTPETRRGIPEDHPWDVFLVVRHAQAGDELLDLLWPKADFRGAFPLPLFAGKDGWGLRRPARRYTHRAEADRSHARNPEPSFEKRLHRGPPRLGSSETCHSCRCWNGPGRV